VERQKGKGKEICRDNAFYSISETPENPADDALAHIVYWKADMARNVRKQPLAVEEKGLNGTDGNQLIYSLGEIAPRRSF
jgi:hypothetical protein